MKLNEANILLISATNFDEYLENIHMEKESAISEEEHWQHRWHQKLPNSELIEAPKLNGDKNITPNHAFLQWVSTIKQAITSSTKPILLIGNSYGVCAALTAVYDLIPNSQQQIKGAFWVAPAIFNVEDETTILEMKKLAFPSFLIASTNDAHMEQIQAIELANNLGSFFVDAGESGSINHQTGHGPWPEGLLMLSQFLSKI